MNKGMSQVLALIVAASVFMMTALTLIFMAEGGIGGAFASTNEQSCKSTIDSKCRSQGGTGTVDPPSSCEKAGYPEYNGQSTEGQVSCEG